MLLCSSEELLSCSFAFGELGVLVGHTAGGTRECRARALFCLPVVQ